MTLQHLVTFDAGSDSYSVLYGTVRSGGQPGYCVDGGTGDSTEAAIRVDPPVIGKVTYLRMGWYKEHSFGNAGRKIALFDQDDNCLGGLGGSAIYSKWDIDGPPASAHTDNDE